MNSLYDKLIRMRGRLEDRIETLKRYETEYAEVENYRDAEDSRTKRKTFQLVLDDVNRILRQY